MFAHGLWLLPNSWDRWAELFEQQGFAALTPGWPDDSETVEEAAEHPGVFAGKSVGQVADHLETIIRGLDRKPAIIGHSTGGLLTQILAGRGLAAVSVAIDPAPFRGVLPTASTARSASPRVCLTTWFAGFRLLGCPGTGPPLDPAEPGMEGIAMPYLRAIRQPRLRWIVTADHVNPSAQAPCTRTMFGSALIGLAPCRSRPP
jgi:pimeloyl-ACP methyl ester carboxylesterase